MALWTPLLKPHDASPIGKLHTKSSISGIWPQLDWLTYSMAPPICQRQCGHHGSLFHIWWSCQMLRIFWSDIATFITSSTGLNNGWHNSYTEWKLSAQICLFEGKYENPIFHKELKNPGYYTGKVLVNLNDQPFVEVPLKHIFTRLRSRSCWVTT